METVSLLFDTDSRVLGEFFTQGGAFARILLTEEGERIIGDAVASWQTQGVPFRREHTDVVYQENVSVRDSAFLDAVRQWSSATRFQLMTLPPMILECWELMARLPLEPVQRYSMLLAMRSLSAEERLSWKQALTEAAAATSAEQEKTQKNIRDMWARFARKA